MVPEFDQVGVRDAAGPDQRSRQDAVRLPHHQAGRQEGGDDAAARRGAAAADRPARLRARAGAGRRSRGRSSRSRSGSRPISTRSPRRRGSPCRSRASSRATSRFSGLGPSPEAASRAFDMKPDEVAGPLRASRGFVFETLIAKQDPYVPKLDEVKDRVRDEVIKQKARDLSKQKAAEIAAKLKAAPDFEKAAKAAGVEAKTTELIARGRADSRPRRRARGRRGGVQAAGRRRQRSDRHRQRHRRRQGAREEGSDARTSGRRRRTASARSCSTDRRNRFFTAYMVEGEAEDEDRRQSRGAAARRVIEATHENTKATKTHEEDLIFFVLLRAFVLSTVLVVERRCSDQH